MMSSLNVDAIIFKMQTEVIATMRESSVAAAGGNIVNGDKLGPLRDQLPDYLTQEWLKYHTFLHTFSRVPYSAYFAPLIYYS